VPAGPVWTYVNGRKYTVERRIDVPDSPRRAIYIGNLLAWFTLSDSPWVTIIAFYPSRMRRTPEMQLEFFDWGIRLKRTHFKRRSDFYEFLYDELAEARLGETMTRRAICFLTGFLPEPLIFLTVDFREIFDRLERQGVPVNRNAEPLAW
jgi:hypothetical protein